MKLCLYFLFSILSFADATIAAPAFNAEICSWFDEEDFKIETFEFAERDALWRIALLKRIEWAILRGVRGPRVGRRIDRQSVANLAATFLPDPGSRFVEDISKSIEDHISKTATSRSDVWSSIIDYQEVLRSLSPAIREIVYAKIAIKLRKLINQISKQFRKDQRANAVARDQLKARKDETIKCLEEANVGLEKAKLLQAANLVKFAVVQSRIDLVKKLIKKFSPHSAIVWTANLVSEEEKTRIQKNIEAISSTGLQGQDLEALVRAEMGEMAKQLKLSSGDIGFVYSKIIDDFAEFVASKADSKRPKIELEMNIFQGMIDRNKAHLERLRSFYA